MVQFDTLYLGCYRVSLEIAVIFANVQLSQTLAQQIKYYIEGVNFTVKSQLEEHQPLYLCATANNFDALKLHAESQKPLSLSSAMILRVQTRR